MIKKKRDFPLKLKKEEALLRRLLPEHKKRKEILQNLKKTRAGYKGELELDHHLSFLPEEKYWIFEELRLPYRDQFFQIDTLVLSPFSAFIIESKNYYGHLYFDSRTKQLIRTFDGQKERFPDPLLQAYRQKIQLQRWLGEHRMKSIPIRYLVSLGNRSTLFDTDRGNEQLFEQILHAEHIPAKLVQLCENIRPSAISPYQLRKLSDLLIQEHTPLEVDILSIYQLQPDDFIRGVPCSRCSHFPMSRIRGKWICPLCRNVSKNAHEQVIIDHLLLHDTITNQECRDLLQVDQEQLVKRLLRQMILPFHGTFKNRTYYLDLS